MGKLLVIQIASTWAMTGIVWFVQRVQYPSFGEVDPVAFPNFHAHHTTAITTVVAPLMILEALSAVASLFAPLRVQAHWELWLGVALVVLIWGSTFLLQVPEHRRLGEGFDEQSWRRLVRTNWIRTVAWSARAVLVTVWLSRSLALAQRLGL